MQLNRTRWIRLVAFFVAIAGCSKQTPTQIVLYLETNLAIPEEINALEIVVTRDRGTEHEVTKTRSMKLVSSSASSTNDNTAVQLPMTLPINAGDAPSSKVFIEVRAKKNETVVVTRAHELPFVKGKAKVLRIRLTQNCVNKSCSSSQTCVEGTCDEQVLSQTHAEALPDYDEKNLFPEEDATITADVVDGGTVKDGAIDVVGDGSPDQSSDSVECKLPTESTCYTGKPEQINVGICRQGTWVCPPNAAQPICDGEIVPKTELCNGIDDNCDKKTDEGCPCTNSSTQPCGSDEGECKKGMQTCVNNAWGSCEGETKPKTELCNNLDDDCDTVIDNDVTKSCYTGPSLTENVGLCKSGFSTCAAGSWGACAGQVLPQNELCDGKDNNCETNIDELWTQLGDSCETGFGACKGPGHIACKSDGSGTECKQTVPKLPLQEICDGKDNDCDEVIDNGLSKCTWPYVKAGDRFGYDVAVDADAGTIAVSSLKSRYVVMYQWNGEQWAYQNQIKETSNLYSSYGNVVDVVGDTLVIGSQIANLYNVNEAKYLVRFGLAWESFYDEKLTPSDAWKGDTTTPGNSRFSDGAFAIDGNTIVVGAPEDRGYSTSTYKSGSAFIFTRNGTSWVETRKFTNPRSGDSLISVFYGRSVDISGNTVVIGSNKYVDFWEKNSSSYWSLTNWGGPIGFPVTNVSIDGGVAAARSEDFKTFLIFESIVASQTTWAQKQSGTASGSEVLGEIAVAADTVYLGRYGIANSGQVDVMLKSTTTSPPWEVKETVKASDSKPNDEFGYSIAVSKDLMVVGAPGCDDGGTDSGAAYVFQRSGTMWKEIAKLPAYP